MKDDTADALRQTHAASQTAEASPDPIGSHQSVPLPTAKPPTMVALGPRLKQFRLRNGWTLEQTSQRTGVARSTLSKIEKGVMSPTFDILQKIALGMRLDIVEFFGTGAQSVPNSRRSITRRGQGRRLDSPMYFHEALSTELSNKRILPFHTTIKARSISEFGPLMTHTGEVFLYVISGQVRVYTELYEATLLAAGDSIYFDSGLAHALISEGDSEAKAIWVCSAP